MSIQIDTFLAFKYPGNIQVSPDEKRFGLIVAKADLKKNHYVHTLMLYEGTQVIGQRALGKNSNYMFIDQDRVLINVQKNKAEQKALKEDYRQSHYIYHLEAKSFTKAFDLPFAAVLERRLFGNWVLLSAQMTEADLRSMRRTKQRVKRIFKRRRPNKPMKSLTICPISSTVGASRPISRNSCFFSILKHRRSNASRLRNDRWASLRFQKI
ncbi:MAG: hypothetical protein EA374_03520 [Acholeplasmatales bacterium]|nr:MAG: hypothetical protein EA374_03520 [Acholeplasmatales bacterium]